MSLIHEALQKLEGEKKESEAGSAVATFEPDSPELTEKPASGIEIQRPAVRKEVLFGIGGVVLIAGVLGISSWLAFSRTPAVSETPSGPVAGSLSRARKPAVDLSRQGEFSLTGISHTGSDWIAIINNQLVRVGETVSGAEVKSIQDREVLLDFNGETVTLKI